MWKLFGYGMAVLFALCVVCIFLLIVWTDAKSTIRYFKANKIIAQVEGCTGEMSTANYGKYQRDTKYRCYVVHFVVAGVCYVDEFLSKKCLSVGDTVEVRYQMNEKQEAEIVNGNVKDRFLRFLICVMIAVPLSVLYILFT